MGTDAGDRVTVQGQVRTVDGRVTLRPSLPTGIDVDTGRQIIVRGELTAAEGSHVSVDGTLDGDELTVLDWVPDEGPDALYRFLRGENGVGRDELPDTHDIVVDGDVIAAGGGRGPTGGRWSTIYAARLTAQIAARVAVQLPGSVYVHGFVRDAGLPALITPDQPLTH